jgi:electron transport complex protein RnfC
MSARTFKGGAHPPERKDRTSGLPIEEVRGVKTVVIPVNQHFGAPLSPLVSPGDKVLKGQKIADAEGRMTVPVHASVSGTVKKIEARTQSNNADGPCIFIEADADQTQASFLPPLDGFSCSKEEALARLREAGLVGMGGAGFPVHVKLAPSKPIELVIANGAECEPYLTIDERAMIERPGDLVEGVALTMRIVGAPKGIIAIEENKAHVVGSLAAQIQARAHGQDIAIMILKTKYPQGGEKMLISAVTGREVPSGGLPMDVGCVVQNIGTLLAMVEAFSLGKPLIERGFTVAGAACTSPKNLLVPIGTLVSDLVALGAISVDDEALGRVIYGGPMMGTAVPHYAIPVQKNTSGVLLMDRKEALHYAEGSCIRCGRCMRACSCKLSPALLNSAIAAGAWKEAEAIGLLDCVECGTCSYVCPSRIQLVQRFRVGKQTLRAIKQKEAQHAGK